MRLDDINALVDASRVYERAYSRVTGTDWDGTVYLDSASDFTQAATACDRSIRRTEFTTGEGGTLSFGYRGIQFCYIWRSEDGR